MAQHEQWELQQLQSLPLDVKIKKTQLRIQEWYEHWDGQVYVSRSGGKDSDVLGNIVKKLYPDVPHVFVNTGLEYDSVRIHAMDISDTVLTPKTSFDQVLKKHGYPIISKAVAQVVKELRSGGKENTLRYSQIHGTSIDKNTGELSHYNYKKYLFLLDAPFKISDACCNNIKKKPFYEYNNKTNRKPIIATTASESPVRKSNWMKNGCNAFNTKNPSSQPISFWTEQDILHYIRLYNIDISSVYGDIVFIDNDGIEYCNSLVDDCLELKTTGEPRTGCVFCLFGITCDTDRLVRLKEREPKKYDYVMRGGKFDESGMWIPHNGLGYKFVIDWLNEKGNLKIKY